MLGLGLALVLLGGGCDGAALDLDGPIASFTAAPDLIDLGDTAVLTAVFSGDTGTLEPDVGVVRSEQAVAVHPTATAEYTLTVRDGAGAPFHRSLTVRVREVTVTATPALATVFSGARATFTATVAGARDTSVRWSVQEPDGGRIDDAGTYTAPLTPGTYHVRAASQADPTRSATATVTVPPIDVRIDPPTATLDPGAQVTLAATVTGSIDGEVTWSLAPTTATATLTASGTSATFTAGGDPGTYTVTATSRADRSRQGSATVTVTPTGVLTISPGVLSIAPGTTQDFSVRLNGAVATAVTWSLVEGTAAGSLGPTGRFTAGTTIGTYHVQATLLADATRVAAAQVTVASAVSIQILPDALALAVGDTAELSAEIAPSGILRAVTWQVQEGAAAGSFATVNGHTVFRPAPAAAGSVVHVTATSVADPSRSSTATLTIAAAPGSVVFVAAGTMATSRSHHATTALLDGTLLVTGGRADVRNDQGTTAAELFDPATRAFTPLATAMRRPRFDHTATRLSDGRVLLAGGFTGYESPDRASAELYDPTTQSFTAAASRMNALRGGGHQALLLTVGPHAGKVLVMGGAAYGYAVDTATDSADLFDPATRTFTPAPGPLQERRTHFTLTELADGRYLIAGGRNPTARLLTSAEIFDPRTMTFTRTAGDLADARAWHTATLMASGQVLVAGGYDGLASAETFDPATGRFTRLAATMMEARFNHTATLLPDGKVVLVGGRCSYWYRVLGSAEVYDPARQDFAYTGRLGRARESHTTTVLTTGPSAQKLLLVGGTDGNELDTAVVQP